MFSLTTLRALTLAAGFAVVPLLAGAQTTEDRTQDRVAFPAHTIIGNLHYVGTGTLNAYLITTPDGHILINNQENVSHDALFNYLSASIMSM